MRAPDASSVIDDLLTTGQAAALLGSSRQHVVDLCEMGRLPHTRLNTHRRVRRTDVEALRHGEPVQTREESRTLWIAHAVAGAYVRDPVRGRDIGLRNVAKMRAAARGGTHRLLDEWEHLLESGDDDGILRSLTTIDPHLSELRQVAPFAGLVPDSERQVVLAAWQATHLGAGSA